MCCFLAVGLCYSVYTMAFEIVSLLITSFSHAHVSYMHTFIFYGSHQIVNLIVDAEWRLCQQKPKMRLWTLSPT